MMERFAVVVHSKALGSTSARLDTWYATRQEAERRARSIRTRTAVVSETDLPDYADKLDWQGSWRDGFGQVPFSGDLTKL